MKNKLVFAICIIFILFLSGCSLFKTVEDMDPNEAMQNLFQEGDVVFSEKYIYYIGGNSEIHEFNIKNGKTKEIAKNKTTSTKNLMLYDNKLYFLRSEENRPEFTLDSFELKTKKYDHITSESDIIGNLHKTKIRYAPSKHGMIYYFNKHNNLEFVSGEKILKIGKPIDRFKNKLEELKTPEIYSLYTIDNEIYYILTDDKRENPDKLFSYSFDTKEEVEVTSVFREINNLGVIEIKPNIYIPDFYNPENIKLKATSANYVNDKKIKRWAVINEKYYQAVTNTETNEWQIDEYDLNGKLLRNIITSNEKIDFASLYVFKNELYTRIGEYSSFTKTYKDNRKGKHVTELENTRFQHITEGIYKVNLD